MRRKIYLASSWRNPHYEQALFDLRADGHLVYDFKNPSPHLPGFSWEHTIEGDEDSNQVESWGPQNLVTALRHPSAQRGFLADYSAMKWCDTLVLLLPCGRSAHLEAGWACGAGKNVHIVLHKDKFEPELMYLMADAVHTSLDSCMEAL